MKAIIGNLMVLFNRVRNDLAIINFCMILVLFFKSNSISAWYFLAIPVYAIYRWIDYKIVMPAEWQKTTDLNPWFQKLEKDIKEIKDALRS